MAGLAAGVLDREIVLQSATKSTDSVTREDILTWAATATIWAQWLPSSAREVWQARQGIAARIEGAYRIYFRSDVYPETSRIVGHDSRTYDVVGITEVGHREGLTVFVAARGENPA